MFDKLFPKWRTQLRDAALGPLLVAEEVVSYKDKWDPKENDNRSYSAALEDVLGDGKNLRFFAIRASVAAALAPMRAARMFDHSAAVWLFNKSAHKNKPLDEAVKLCAVAFNQNHRNPLTVPQVVRATRDLFGYHIKTRVHSCENCAEKDKLIEQLQAEIEAIDSSREKSRATSERSE